MFERFKGFEYSEVAGVGFEDGVTRRDPSPVILVGDTYYVWYSRTEFSPDGYSASVWYATSPDGHAWTEQGEALPKGPRGAFDEHAVFTPTILVAEGRYYLFYTAVPEPFTNDNGGPKGTPTAIGVAVADSPDGPWTRYAGNPVLLPSTDPAKFDSMRVDDACMIVRQGKYWMYYKGRQQENTPGHTKMGVAVADSPTGPYVKYDGNPVVDSGHEVCIWPHGDVLACLICNIGPQGNTLQISRDGLHFDRVLSTAPPAAPGPYRADNFIDGKCPGISWGLAIGRHPQWPHLVRFDCDLTAD